MYANLARQAGARLIKRYPILNSRAAYAKYGVLGNEAWHMAYKYARKRYRKIRRRGRRYIRRMTRATKRARITPTKRIYEYGDHPKRRGDAKTAVLGSNGFLNYNTHTLYPINLSVFPERHTDLNSGLHFRERDTIIHKGSRVEIYCKNNTDKPIYCNIAIVHPKEGNVISVTEWFRNESGISSTTRGKDFNTSTDSLTLHRNPINTDKYQVLSHWRFKLQPNAATAGYNTDKLCTKNIKRWYRLNRRLTFAQATDTIPNNGVLIMALWFSVAGAASVVTPTTNAVSLQHRTVNYFRDAI